MEKKLARGLTLARNGQNLNAGLRHNYHLLNLLYTRLYSAHEPLNWDPQVPQECSAQSPVVRRSDLCLEPKHFRSKDCRTFADSKAELSMICRIKLQIHNDPMIPLQVQLSQRQTVSILHPIYNGEKEFP